MSVAICTSEGKAAPHVPLELAAESTHEVAVLAEQGPYGYELTNRYVDGIIGVSDEDMAEAECDEQPVCMACGCLIDHWDHQTPIRERA